MLITVEGIDGAGKSTLVAGLADALERPRAGRAARAGRRRALRAPARARQGPRADRRRACGGADLRGRPRPARGGAAAAAARRRPARAARPLRGLLAGLPGRRARARRRRGAGAQRVRHRRDRPGPHAAAADRPGRRAGACRRPRWWAKDRIEAEREAFWLACARAYDELAAAEPDRWAVLDASQPAEQVLAGALAQLAPLLEP